MRAKGVIPTLGEWTLKELPIDASRSTFVLNMDISENGWVLLTLLVGITKLQFYPKKLTVREAECLEEKEKDISFKSKQNSTTPKYRIVFHNTTEETLDYSSSLSKLPATPPPLTFTHNVKLLLEPHSSLSCKKAAEVLIEFLQGSQEKHKLSPPGQLLFVEETEPDFCETCTGLKSKNEVQPNFFSLYYFLSSFIKRGHSNNQMPRFPRSQSCLRNLLQEIEIPMLESFSGTPDNFLPVRGEESQEFLKDNSAPATNSTEELTAKIRNWSRLLIDEDLPLLICLCSSQHSYLEGSNTGKKSKKRNPEKDFTIFPPSPRPDNRNFSFDGSRTRFDKEGVFIDLLSLRSPSMFFSESSEIDKFETPHPLSSMQFKLPVDVRSASASKSGSSLVLHSFDSVGVLPSIFLEILKFGILVQSCTISPMIKEETCLHCDFTFYTATSEVNEGSDSLDSFGDVEFIFPKVHRRPLEDHAILPWRKRPVRITKTHSPDYADTFDPDAQNRLLKAHLQSHFSYSQISSWESSKLRQHNVLYGSPSFRSQASLMSRHSPKMFSKMFSPKNTPEKKRDPRRTFTDAFTADKKIEKSASLDRSEIKNATIEEISSKEIEHPLGNEFANSQTLGNLIKSMKKGLYVPLSFPHLDCNDAFLQTFIREPHSMEVLNILTSDFGHQMSMLYLPSLSDISPSECSRSTEVSCLDPFWSGLKQIYSLMFIEGVEISSLLKTDISTLFTQEEASLDNIEKLELLCSFPQARTCICLSARVDFTYINGESYHGESRNKFRHGWGIYKYGTESPVSFYEGQWAFNMKHGIGFCHKKDKSMYSGDWVENRMHGHGTMVLADGSKFEGNFDKNVKDGIGITCKDGILSVGHWCKGKRSGPGIVIDCNSVVDSKAFLEFYDEEKKSSVPLEEGWVNFKQNTKSKDFFTYEVADITDDETNPLKWSVLDLQICCYFIGICKKTRMRILHHRIDGQTLLKLMTTGKPASEDQFVKLFPNKSERRSIVSCVHTLVLRTKYHHEAKTDMGNLEGMSFQILDFMRSHILSHSGLRLLREVASGGFGIVLEGEWHGTPVAVKQLLNLSYSQLLAFGNEAQMLSQLRHPNIALFIGISMTNIEKLENSTDYRLQGVHTPFVKDKKKSTRSRKVLTPRSDTSADENQQLPTLMIISELVDGHTLFDFIHKLSYGDYFDDYGLFGVDGFSLAQDPDEALPPLPLPTILRISFGIANAMTYLHDKEILHCDLKPQNILLDSSLNPKLCDFGLSTVRQPRSLEYWRLGALGTPRWAAPEVLRGDAHTEKADIYSFGIILWEMVNRVIPFEELETEELVAAVGWGKASPMKIPRSKEVHPTCLEILIRMCIHPEAYLRPTFRQVSAALHYLRTEQLSKPARETDSFVCGR
eukprot:GHVP01015076.1.p1 GENE.GHVP01015076.1~~GHVP01015076.1.p1  ORF type:complete len:1395 (-),score=256.08 GHVP01015076.1:159-4343(-)